MISKSQFIRGLQCQKSLYLHKKRPFLRSPLPPDIKEKYKRGHKIGVIAQKLFPGGKNIFSFNKKAYKSNIEKVTSLINSNTPVTYEVPFIHNDLMAVMDILINDNGKWKAYEIKSSLLISDTYLWDITFQKKIMQLFGLKDVECNIIHLNPEYKLQDTLNLKELFVTVNVDDEISKKMGLIDPLIEKCRATEKLEKSPDITIGHQCDYPYECDFKNHCWKHIIAPSIFQIPGFSDELKYKLLLEGKSDLQSALPLIHNIKQKNIANALFHKKTIIQNDEIKSFLPSNEKPVKFFKFFTSTPPIPLAKNYKPYEIFPICIIEAEVCNSDFIFKTHTFTQTEKTYKDQVLETILSFFDNNKTHNLVCFEDELILHSIENISNNTLNNVDVFNQITDLSNIFKNAWYCSDKIDSNNNLESIFRNFNNEDFSEKLFKEYKNYLNTILYLDEHFMDFGYLEETSKIYFYGLYNIYMKLQDLQE